MDNFDYINKFAAPQDKQLQMWEEWKSSGEHPDKLRPLQAQFTPTIFKSINRYQAQPTIPMHLIEAQANNLFIQALRTYNPEKAQLNTHVTNMLNRVDRYVKTYQNAGRIQETRAQSMGSYLSAKLEIQEEMGRAPTAQELSERMTLQMGKTITPKEAERYMKEERSDVSEAHFSDTSFTFIPSSSRMVLKLIYEELSPEEKAVFERLHGINGAKKMRAGDVARELNMHPSKISRIRTAIEAKVKKYL